MSNIRQSENRFANRIVRQTKHLHKKKILKCEECEKRQRSNKLTNTIDQLTNHGHCRGLYIEKFIV